MNRRIKLELLQEIFNNRNLNAIKDYDIIQMEKLLKVNPDTLSNEDLEKCLEYLSIDTGEPYKKLNLSTWTNQQLESRLFELDNKLKENE